MIPGEHVNVRAIERRDSQLLYDWLNDPAVMRGWGWGAPAPSSHVLARQIEDWLAEEPSLGRPAAFVAESMEGDPVGLVILRVDRPEARSVELSLLVGEPSRWGQGIGADMLHTVLEACFAQWGILRVGVRVEEDNARALALYRRFGFQAEGRLRRAAFRDGRFWDILLFSLLAAEWTEGEGEESQDCGTEN